MLFRSILGRTDDMYVVRGVNLQPSAFEEIVRRFDQVAEYQVRLIKSASLTEIIVAIEPTHDCPNSSRLAKEIETALSSAFLMRIPVVPVVPGTLPCFEMKAKRWVTL